VNKTLREEVEAEYNFLLNSFKSSVNNSNSKESSLEEIIEKLSPFNLELELVGSWLWVHGDSRSCIDSLKQLKLRFSPGKKSWYWRPDKFRSINRDPMDMEAIRQLYGSKKASLTN
jgi:hypothetical protein